MGGGTIERKEICKELENSFVTVSDKVAGIHLCKENATDCVAVLPNQVHKSVLIHTTGDLAMQIVCCFEEKLMQMIAQNMYGGELPARQLSLYIKEYVNIVCGYGVSELNNRYHTKIRLSVPICLWQEQNENLCEKLEQPWIRLAFDTNYGTMSVQIFHEI